MIKTDANKNSLKEIRDRDRKEKEAEIKTMCEAIAVERLGGHEALIKLSNKHQGIWYLPIMDDEGGIEKMAILKPIDRHILSFASTKMEDEGLYIFLEAAMRQCFHEEFSDMEILDDDKYFLPASGQFNKLIEGKKAFMLKR